MFTGDPHDGTAGASPAHADRQYTISQLAQEFGLTPRTIRFYEDEGLLTPERSGTSRVYSHRDRARLILICRAKRLGFSVADIKEFLDLYTVDADGSTQLAYILKRARERIAALERQRGDVEQMLSELHTLEATLLAQLRARGTDPDAP